MGENNYSGPVRTRGRVCVNDHAVEREIQGNCSVCILERARAARAADRRATIEAYGGRCVCCGEAWSNFLQVDHVGGGGNAHRRELKGGSAIGRLLRRLGYPDDYQLLCANCNQAKGAGRDCPSHHDQETRNHGAHRTRRNA